MTKLFFLLVAVITTLVSTQSMAESILCQSQDQRMRLSLKIESDRFPKAIIQGTFLANSITTELHLMGWYSQRFDYTENKEFGGYFIPSTGRPDAEDNYLQTFFEVIDNKESNHGTVEIRNAQLTGTTGTVELPCKKREE